jgi:hypothetical protein
MFIVHVPLSQTVPKVHPVQLCVVFETQVPFAEQVCVLGSQATQLLPCAPQLIVLGARTQVVPSQQPEHVPQVLPVEIAMSPIATVPPSPQLMHGP